MTVDVNTRSDAVVKMAANWPIIDALMGGTPTMRAAGASLLPRWPNEDAAAHAARVAVATLFPAFRRTLTVMAGKPFSRQVTLSEDTPDLIREWSGDIDRQGTALHPFCANVFSEALGWGFAGILVDSPRGQPSVAKRTPTVAEQRSAGMRPYFVHIRHDQILGWRTAQRSGVTVLTQLRIAEDATVEDGEYGERCVDRVRVLRPGSFELWERQDTTAGTSWMMVDSGLTGVDFIPFVPMYGSRKRFMVGETPLLDLAFLNVKHWQSQSDQDTILHVARVPILFAKGFASDTQIVIGSSAAIRSDSVDSDLKFVEHSGAAISAGKDSLLALEEQMIQTGAELLVAKPGQRSAMEAGNDAEANKSELQRLSEDAEDALDLALSYMAKFASLDSGGSVTLYKDFAMATLSEASARLVNEMQGNGLITKRTAIREQQRRGILSPDLDPDDEIALAAEEAPPPVDEADEPVVTE